MNQNDLYKQLSEQGKLNSLEKDGKPSGVIQKLIGYSYPIILIILSFINIYLYRKLKDRLKLKPFLLTVIIGSIVGWAWGLLLENYDPKFPAWLFNPWSYSGIYWYQALEDWLFYPICGIFFLLICELINIPYKENKYLPKVIHIINFLILVLPLAVFKIAGISEIVFFGIPGFICLLKIKKINIPHYLVCCSFFIVFACLWDIWGVTLLHSIKGFSWAQQWSYRVIDINGNILFSKVFIPDSWAWIGESPVEITPFFSIYGSMFIYGVYFFIKEKYLK